MNIDDKIKRALFNGRTLNNKFRRGLWTADELSKANIADKPDIPADCAKLYYSDGCIAFYISQNGQLVINSDNRMSDVTSAIIELFKASNKSVKVIEKQLGGATRQGGVSRDWQAVFNIAQVKAKKSKKQAAL